jgi:hypothetical protein
LRPAAIRTLANPSKSTPPVISGGRAAIRPVSFGQHHADAFGRPAGLTLKQFMTTLRTGHHPLDPPGEILQVMPWPVFGKKVDQDLNSVYEYLRSIPSIEN